jgi:hypothetical protein
MIESHRPFVYVPHKGTKPPQELKQRLDQLRYEFAAKAMQIRRVGHPHGK